MISRRWNSCRWRIPDSSKNERSRSRGSFWSRFKEGLELAGSAYRCPKLSDNRWSLNRTVYTFWRGAHLGCALSWPQHRYSMRLFRPLNPADGTLELRWANKHCQFLQWPIEVLLGQDARPNTWLTTLPDRAFARIARPPVPREHYQEKTLPVRWCKLILKSADSSC